MHLGISQNNTINSFVGRLEEIWSNDLPSRSGLLLHELFSASFMMVSTQTARAQHVVFI